MKKKTVKAWAVVDIAQPVSMYFTALHRSVAISWREDSCAGLPKKYLRTIKVIPCIITYSVPSPKNK